MRTQRPIDQVFPDVEDAAVLGTLVKMYDLDVALAAANARIVATAVLQ